MITFTPQQDFSSTLHQARLDVEAWCAARGEGREAKWAQWGGDAIDEMLRDREATLRFLQHRDATLRLAAMSLVAEYWWPSAELFAADTLRLAFEDRDPRVRGAAVMALPMIRQYVADRSGFLSRLLGELSLVPEEDVAELLREVCRVEAKGLAAMKTVFETLAGPHAGRMLESRAAAESFLSHLEPSIRMAALCAVYHHWGMTKESADVCEKLVLKDGDTDVRAMALANVAGYYAETDDKRVGQFVARLVCDSSRPLGLRAEAYKGLFCIRGMPLESQMKVTSKEFRFPDDVDWSFVRTFLPEK